MSSTKINPKMPQFYPNGGGTKGMTASLDDLHSKELEALIAKQAYDLHALQEKHRKAKAALLKPAKTKRPGRSGNK